MEADMDEEAGKETVNSSLRRSTRSIPAPSAIRKGQRTTPTKPSASKKARIDTSAFEDAISATGTAPSPSPSPTKGATARKGETAIAPVVGAAAIQAEEGYAEVTEEAEIPYEPYLDDMLIAWRNKKSVRRLLKDAELWRQNMLEKLQAIA
jgi:hypothetical protein